jgi:crotonobetainyl-CoA:carnitine CoA-transferase CaiB-like acyl-CoA transferase
MEASQPEATPSARPLPLSGITVIDLSRVVAGPYCTMMLADLGATVIKVEHPSDPDYVRDFPPRIAGGRAAYFAQYNRWAVCPPRPSTPRARHCCSRWCAGGHPGRLPVRHHGQSSWPGLANALQAANPRLIYTAISGFGHSGPNAPRPSFDSTAQAAGGLWSMNGYPDQPPVRVGSIIGDLAASFYATIGTLAALREVDRGGPGQMVDISQQDSVVTLTESAIVNYTVDRTVARPLGSAHPFARPYGQYPCKDGFVFFGSYSDKLWRDTCAIFGEPELADDPEIDTMVKRFDEATFKRRIEPLIERWFMPRTKAELEAMAGHRIALTPVKSIDEVVADPHLRARGMFVEVATSDATVEVFGSPMKLSATPVRDSGPVPSLGQHNREVYLDWLGISAERYEALLAGGVI